MGRDEGTGPEQREGRGEAAVRTEVVRLPPQGRVPRRRRSAGLLVALVLTAANAGIAAWHLAGPRRPAAAAPAAPAVAPLPRAPALCRLSVRARSGFCTLRAGSRIWRRRAPCSFTVPCGSQLRLRVVRRGYRSFRRRWVITSDESMVFPRRAGAPVSHPIPLPDAGPPPADARVEPTSHDQRNPLPDASVTDVVPDSIHDEPGTEPNEPSPEPDQPSPEPEPDQPSPEPDQPSPEPVPDL